jgi:hypothetical protein
MHEGSGNRIFWPIDSLGLLGNRQFANIFKYIKKKMTYWYIDRPKKRDNETHHSR